jgi:hypothetical protein
MPYRIECERRAKTQESNPAASKNPVEGSRRGGDGHGLDGWFANLSRGSERIYVFGVENALQNGRITLRAGKELRPHDLDTEVHKHH